MNISLPIKWKGIDTEKEKDANILGEALRHFVFIGTSDDVGCYTTFKENPIFTKVNEQKEIDRIKEILVTEEFEPTIYQYEIKYKNIPEEFRKCAKPLKILVAWYWDGDGTLYFEITENNITRRLINTDCKKDYEWEFIK